MKLSTALFLLPTITVTVAATASAATLRTTCDDGPSKPATTPTPTPADTPAPTPAPTTSAPTPAPTTLEAPFVYFDVNGQTIRSGDTPQLDKCYSWNGCIRSRDALGKIAWERLGPAGAIIQFYRTRACGGDAFESFAADAPNAFASPEITQYQTFVVRSSFAVEIDRSDAFGCQK